MNSRGTFVVFVMLLLGILAGIAALVVTWSRGYRALEFWGTETAYAIRHAPQVELLELEVNSDPTKGRGNWSVKKSLDISQARGLVHMRQALIEDASFVWDQKEKLCDSSWSHALVFTNQGVKTTLLFNLECAVVSSLKHQDSLDCSPIEAGLKEVFAEQFELQQSLEQKKANASPTNEEAPH